MNIRHIGLVIAQEFRMRLRTGRWRWLLGLWVLLLGAFTMLFDAGLDTGYGLYSDDSMRGVPLFGFLMYFVLGSMLVISPALTAQTINGDRERGTLATLQVTKLRPFEIASGKLIASWSVGLVALALSLPFAGYAFTQGGVPIERMAAIYGVVGLLIGTICAMAQALSALLARSITSALLSYVVTAALVFGSLISFFLGTQLTRQTVTVENEWGGYTYVDYRPDQVWWLLAPNPFVIVADAAPRVPPRRTQYGNLVRYENYDPLSAISNSVRELRLPRDGDTGWVADGDGYVSDDGRRLDSDDLAVWPYGLGFSILLGAASLAITTVRLRTPTRRLARGVRVA